MRTGMPASRSAISHSSGSPTSAVATAQVECDEAGNVIKRYNEDGNVVVEYEYANILDAAAVWSLPLHEFQVNLP